MAHEARVDDRDALPGGEGGELRRDGAGAVRRDDDETECAQIALDRRRLDRLTGEDGGRQTDSLPGFAKAAPTYTVGRHERRGYRIPEIFRSPPVLFMVARAPVIIMVDPGSPGQTPPAEHRLPPPIGLAA
jgi:hypothetical protein